MRVGVAGNRTRYQSGVYDSTCESGQFCQDEWYRDNKCLLASQIYRFCMSGTFFFRESNEPCEDSEWKNGCLQPIFPGTGFIGRMPATEKERSGIEVAEQDYKRCERDVALSHTEMKRSGIEVAWL